jgi:hypothetical protein
VPTPFYHLNVAKELLNHPALEAWQPFLEAHRGAFLFGNTAPDVQTVSGQSRPATHFFDIPLRNNTTLPWMAMLDRYAGLTNPQRMVEHQAAFIAGYLCHLQADWFWVKQIFVPNFVKSNPMGSFPKRLYLHNVLRSYLDLEILPGVSNGMSAELKNTTSRGWLPFVQDAHLNAWRDFLTGQLEPGAPVKTVEVFAARQGVPPENYYLLLQSEDRMETEVFAHLPRERLQRYRQSLIDANIELLQSYLEGKMH